MNKISDIGLFIFILFKNFGVKTLKSKYDKDVYTFIPCRAAKKKDLRMKKLKQSLQWVKNTTNQCFVSHEF